MQNEFGAVVAWAMETIQEDFISVQRQIVEYGSVDLEMMGVGLLEAAHWDATIPSASANPGMEMALVFYLQGKISRAVSAIAAGHLPSQDTLRDIRVYALMLAHVREYGHWNITLEETADGRLVSPKHDRSTLHGLGSSPIRDTEGPTPR